MMFAGCRTYPGLNGLAVSITSGTPSTDVVSLSTVSPVDPAVVEGGLPGPVVFATMLNSVSAIVACLV